jgi:hypothetical protein
MTVVCAVVRPSGLGRVVSMLSDTAVSSGNELQLSAVPKVRRTGGYVYGCSGDGRACDVAVRWALPRWPGTNPRAWVVDELAPVIRQRLRDCDERGADLELLLGVGGIIMSLDEQLNATCWPDGYGAIGAGASVALGSLYTTRRWPWRQRLGEAVRAAERHCSSSCRGRGRVVSA